MCLGNTVQNSCEIRWYESTGTAEWPKSCLCVWSAQGMWVDCRWVVDCH